MPEAFVRAYFFAFLALSFLTPGEANASSPAIYFSIRGQEISFWECAPASRSKQSCKRKTLAPRITVPLEKVKRRLISAFSVRTGFRLKQSSSTMIFKIRPDEEEVEQLQNIREVQRATRDLQRFASVFCQAEVCRGLLASLARPNESVLSGIRGNALNEVNALVEKLVSLSFEPSKPEGVLEGSGESASVHGIARALIRGSELSQAKYATVKAGKFSMFRAVTLEEGPAEEIAKEVEIAKDFELQTTAVTQAQWLEVMGFNPSLYSEKAHCPHQFARKYGVGLCPQNPVEMVTWYDASEFISQLNASDARYFYRLPTEAEWQFAATNANLKKRKPELKEIAWFRENAKHQTHPVAQLRPNGLGLYDMFGNVWQWTADSDLPRGSKDSTNSAEGPDKVGVRVLKGGAWRSPAELLRPGARNLLSPDSRVPGTGFRLVRERRSAP